MPHWLFALFLTGLACVIALDFISIWELGSIGAYASASVAASIGLLIAVTLRRTSEILISVGLIGAAFVAAILLTTPLTPETLPAQLVTLAIVVLPPVFATWFVVQFRRIVQIELDRVLVQSTVSAPRFAPGAAAGSSQRPSFFPTRSRQSACPRASMRSR